MLHYYPRLCASAGRWQAPLQCIGHSVRLDHINRYGPTDAWVTLDTVTLTNTSQLYFGTSSIGQPARLYRLIQVP